MRERAKLIIDIGGNAPWVNNTHPHGINALILEGGWNKFIAERVQPVLQWAMESGKRPRLQLYNPFSGKVEAGPSGHVGPQFDQWTHAKNAGLPTVRDFAEAWRPITAVADVDVYYGKLDDKDFARRTAPDKLDDWARRFQDAISPLVNAGMSAVIDMFTDYQPLSIEYKAVIFADAQLVRPMKFEGWPLVTCPHLWRHDYVFTQHVWREAPKFAVNANLSSLTGEIIRWFNEIKWLGSDEATAKSVLDFAWAVQGDGHTPLVPAEHMMRAGINAKDIL